MDIGLKTNECRHINWHTDSVYKPHMKVCDDCGYVWWDHEAADRGLQETKCEHSWLGHGQPEADTACGKCDMTYGEAMAAADAEQETKDD